MCRYRETSSTRGWVRGRCRTGSMRSMSATFRDAAKYLESIGAELRPQEVTEWQGPFQLSESIVRLYAELGPVNVTVPGYGNDFFLPALRDLWNYQAGYRSDAVTGQDIADWDKDLLVVADQGADPIVVSQRDGAVLRALHGQGSWDFKPLTDSVTDFVVAIAVLGAVIEQARYMNLTLDDDFVNPAHVREAEGILIPLVGAAFTTRILNWA